jgi:hypothetical protein
MSVRFAQLIEKIKGLDIESKEYLMDIIKKLLIEERRKEIKSHAEQSLQEYKEGRIKFGNVRDLKAAMHED